MVMQTRILDLDGGIPRQKEILAHYRPASISLPNWGPSLRMGCTFGQFRRFEHALASALGGKTDDAPTMTLYGSGDFHHVSLALLRRQSRPFNLLILDNHPDWMRGLPFLHCGTWLYHAARLPLLKRIFHAGGEVDFDNSFRYLAPWPDLRSGKITVLPAWRRFQRGRWPAIAHAPLRQRLEDRLDPDRLEKLIEPFRADLGKYPLYVSLDKDVLQVREAVVNWDSGHLTLDEVRTILNGFLGAAEGNLAGADLLGDWSPVRMRSLFRRFLHLTEHPSLTVDPAAADVRNAKTNRVLLETITGQPSAGCHAFAALP